MSTPEELFRGPIPGENYTSDVRNYPWHRPPDLIEYDEIVDYTFDKLTDEDNIHKMLALLGAGLDVSTLVGIAHLQNISRGKYSIDMALLTAGPIARLIQIHCEQNGVTVDMGLKEPNPPVTKDDVLRAMGLIDEEGNEISEEEIVEQAASPLEDLEQTPEEEGLMSMPNEPATQEEQDEMLGLTLEEEEEVIV